MGDITQWLTASIPGLLTLAVAGNALFAWLSRFARWGYQHTRKTRTSSKQRDLMLRRFYRASPDRLFMSKCVYLGTRVAWFVGSAILTGMGTSFFAVAAYGGLKPGALLPAYQSAIVLLGYSLSVFTTMEGGRALWELGDLVGDLHESTIEASVNDAQAEAKK